MSQRLLIWPATSQDAAGLLVSMRASDREEIAFVTAFSGRKMTARQVVEESMASHQVWAMHAPEGLVALCGAAPKNCAPGEAAIWLLGTDLMDRKWRATTRAARRFVEVEKRRYRFLFNVVPKHMPERVRWVRHLGFDTLPEEANGPAIGVVPFWSRS